LLDPADDVPDLEVGRVDRLRIGRGAHLRRVALVPEAEVGGERVGADPRPLRASPPGPGRRVREEVDLHVGVREHDGADVAAFDHRVAAVAELALPHAHHLPDGVVPSDDRDEPVDAGLADRRSHVGARDEYPPALVEDDGVLGRELGEPIALTERHAPLHGEPRQRAVHGARVEVAEAEPLREPLRHGALASPGGAVDGHDHRWVTESRSSKKPGKLIATASAPLTSTPSRETSPAIAPSIATRWSPAASTPPPLGREGIPLTPKPSSLARMRMPRARRAFVTVSMRSVSFTRSSRAPCTELDPRAYAAASAKSGSSSRRSGASSGWIEVATS